MKKATQQLAKDHNKRLILRTIYTGGQISRANVARLTRLTRTTVSGVVSDLLQEGLVEEVGLGPSEGGKPPVLLRFNDDARHLIGIDLADSEFRGAVVNLRGVILHRHTLPIYERDGEAALTLVYTLIEQLLKATNRPILGIGIGAPGLMEPQSGVVVRAVNLDWHDLPLGDLLKERFNLPIHIANDSQVAAFAEFTFNNPDHLANLISVTVSRGVGAGIVLDGKLFYGDNFGAGEIGHVRMVEEGEQCRCGNYGCLETLVSSRAIVRQARALAEQDPDSILNQLAATTEMINSDLVLQAYHSNDEAVCAIIDKVGLYLGTAIAHLVGALNINHVVITGSVSRFGNGLSQIVQSRVNEGVLPLLARRTRVVASSMGDEIVIQGAAGLLLSYELGVV